MNELPAIQVLARVRYLLDLIQRADDPLVAQILSEQFQAEAAEVRLRVMAETGAAAQL